MSSPSHVYRDGMLEPLRNAELLSPTVERVGRGRVAVAPWPDPQPARAASSGVRSRAAAIAISQRTSWLPDHAADGEVRNGLDVPSEANSQVFAANDVAYRSAAQPPSRDT